MRKAASVWKCSTCDRTVKVEPGTPLEGNRCAHDGCRGRMEYQGGSWVYPDDDEYKRISKYFREMK